MLLVIVRTIIVRFIYLFPFILGIFFTSTPYNIITLCILIIKNKMEPDSERFEITVFLDFIARKINIVINDDSDIELKEIKEHFLQPEKYIQFENVKNSNTLIYCNMIYNIFEGIMIFIGLIFVLFKFIIN